MEHWRLQNRQNYDELTFVCFQKSFSLLNPPPILEEGQLPVPKVQEAPARTFQFY